MGLAFGDMSHRMGVFWTLVSLGGAGPEAGGAQARNLLCFASQDLIYLCVARPKKVPLGRYQLSE